MNEHTQLSLQTPCMDGADNIASCVVCDSLAGSTTQGACSSPHVNQTGEAPPSAAGGPPVDMWRHSSGLLLPRGTVVTTRPDPEDWDAIAAIRAEVEAGSARRGVVQAALDARKVKRSHHNETQLQSFCSWLSSKGVDIIGTVTFTDEYAARRGIYSLNRALDDVWSGLLEVPMKRGQIVGFRNRFVLTGEWHPSGRQVPHVHLALESRGAPMEAVCSDLFRHFVSTRGRSRFEPMRDTTEATLYGLKDTIKSSDLDPDCIRLRLVRPKRQRKR